MTYGASRLDLLLIERLILYLLAKWSGSMSAENICTYICVSRDFFFLDRPSNGQFENVRVLLKEREREREILHIALTKVAVLIADGSRHLFKNDMMTCAFQVLAASYVGQ